MKPNVMLMIASLLSIILMIFHMTADIVRGMEPGTLFDLIIVPILAVWLYETLVLREKRSGYIIVLAITASTARPDHPHEGSGRRRRDREIERRLLPCLDADRARRDFAVLGHALGARAVGAAARA